MVRMEPNILLMFIVRYSWLIRLAQNLMPSVAHHPGHFAASFVLNVGNPVHRNSCLRLPSPCQSCFLMESFIALFFNECPNSMHHHAPPHPKGILPFVLRPSGFCHQLFC